MTDNRQYMALEWVIKDIKETLLQAQHALGAYIGEPTDVIQLKFCLTYIHQVYGTLHMSGFHGAAMIASEIEVLARDLLENTVSHKKEACDVLVKAIKELPEYLEHALKEKRDQPSLVFSLLNDLRAARGAQFLSESTLFAPNLSYANDRQGVHSAIAKDDKMFREVLAKLRKMYQYAAASVIHNNNLQENLTYLAKVGQRLQEILQNTQRSALWEIVVAFISGVSSNSLPDSASVKKLLRQLDEELKQLIDQGLNALDTNTPDERLKNWLYYLSSFDETTDEIDCINQQYQLDNAFPVAQSTEDSNYASPVESSAMQAVARAIVDEFAEVNKELSHCITHQSLSCNFEFIRHSFQRVSDTLAVLDVAHLRKEMLANIARIEKITSTSNQGFPEALLGEVFASLAHIESELETSLISSQTVSESGEHHFSSSEIVALQDSRNGLEEAKDAVVAYIASQWNIKSLQPVPDLLRDVSENLISLSLGVPSQVLLACANYIEMKLINRTIKPEWEQLDSLADVIASIDYFLEILALTHEPDMAILNGAKKGLVNLGVPESRVNQILLSQPVSIDEASVEIIDDEGITSNEVNVKTDASSNERSDDDLDDESTAEIIEIFVEEAEEVLETIHQRLPEWRESFKDHEALVDVRRSFHTLKGSGRLVKASDIGEMSWSIENMLNRILDKTLPPNKHQVLLIDKVLALLPSMIDAFRLQQLFEDVYRCEQYQQWAHQLAQGDQSEALFAALERETESDTEPSKEDNHVDDDYIELSSDEQSEDTEVLGVVTEDDDIDVQLWEIFGTESETHLMAIREYISAMDAANPFFEPPSDAMQRAMHTLKGSAYMAEITPIAKLMTPMELFVKDLRAYQVSVDEDILQLIKDSVSYTEDALEQMSSLAFPEIEKLDLFLARVAELRERAVGHLIKHENENEDPAVDPAFLEKLMHEGMDSLLDINPLVLRWRHETLPPSSPSKTEWQRVAYELSNVQHAAERANLAAMARLSGDIHQQYLALLDGRLIPNDAVYDTLLDAHYVLLDIIDAIAGGQDLPEVDQNIFDSLSELVIVEPEPEAENAIESVLPEPETLPSNVVDDDIDEEIAEIFMEEAKELLEELDEIIHDWENGESAKVSNEAIQRMLHTFKGGARLAGLMTVGNLAHDFESYLISQLGQSASESYIQDVYQYQDQLIHYIEAIEAGDMSGASVPPVVDTPAELPTEEPSTAESVINNNDEFQQNEFVDNNNDYLPDNTYSSPEDTFLDAQENQSIEENLLPDEHDNPVDIDDDHTTDNSTDLVEAGFEHVEESLLEQADSHNHNVLSFPANAPPVPEVLETTTVDGNAARRVAPQETVKVSAELMEELVNLAGETSISRGRMEEQISEMGYSLEEMDQTVARLQEQLRRLDIETEAQVLFRQEQLGGEEGFDPLEMDRYSQLQQLSRSLIESASDLRDLKFTLSNKARDAETVLLQQSRVNTELQEGLMRSRMVPFSRIVPRLRRIVRQISTELGKEVNFEFNNPEGELDRNMMERMIAPLEHMLRNAIDHGIEPVDYRRQQGKPDAGRIVLSLAREGSNVLLRLSDDGAGMSVDHIRDKAIEKGLMPADAQLRQKDILQFIFNAGFSTAATVTQISGRGVGMDVVSSEIRQLGGTIDIDSIEGQGTQFSIRLPFTVSVNRALMINMGDSHYAVPLNSIEGIARIQPDDLQRFYEDPDSRFEYAGTAYQVQYLGTLLDKGTKPKIEGHLLPVPVLLVKGVDYSVAIQVDELQGSREIVVKTLGAQFSTVQGLSGATIMGDGHVVVILDIYGMIRQQQTIAHDFVPTVDQIEHAPQEVARNPLVMVVDDSVTVRKVTTRFLEREGFDVITAKDGLDAVTMLLDRTPDIMLLDIEMPRMDGFEVARRVRGMSSVSSLPIIMITSRTGEKHRQTGLAAGANDYMGKPYQETELLASMNRLLSAQQSN